MTRVRVSEAGAERTGSRRSRGQLDTATTRRDDGRRDSTTTRSVGSRVLHGRRISLVGQPAAPPVAVGTVPARSGRAGGPRAAATRRHAHQEAAEDPHRAVPAVPHQSATATRAPAASPAPDHRRRAGADHRRRAGAPRPRRNARGLCIRYDTIRDAILTCARKPT